MPVTWRIFNPSARIFAMTITPVPRALGDRASANALIAVVISRCSCWVDFVSAERKDITQGCDDLSSRGGSAGAISRASDIQLKSGV
jgi:hypothetical protein